MFWIFSTTAGYAKKKIEKDTKVRKITKDLFKIGTLQKRKTVLYKMIILLIFRASRKTLIICRAEIIFVNSLLTGLLSPSLNKC